MRNKNIKYLGFDDHLLTIIGVPLVGFLMPILFFDASLKDGLIGYLPKWGGSTYFSFMYWMGTRWVLIYVRKRYPEFTDAHKRILMQVVYAVVYALVISQVSQLFIEPFIFRNHEEPGISGVAATYGIIFLMIAIYESIYFYYQLKLTIEEKEEVRRAQLHSELEGLRNQVNPHFLFNSLNTLMNIVAEDQKLAISFLKKLSKVYRYVLDSRREQLIALATEMEFMESYIFLQKERFQSSLQIVINVPQEAMKLQIIPLAMQILFENAVKHNIVSSKKPLMIKVYQEGDYLIIENNLQLKNVVMPGTKVGLENVRTRYSLFTEKEVRVVNDGKKFSVALPLIKSTVVVAK